MENEMAYMREHPPRCLDGDAKPASDSLVDYSREQLGDNTTVFTPLCECSNEFVTISSSMDFSPTNIICPRCGKTRTIFDPGKHGYDGELGFNADIVMATPEEIACAKCGNKTFRVALAFQYSGETDVLEEDDSLDIKPEDLFGWIMIVAQCEQCDAVQEVTQHECA